MPHTLPSCCVGVFSAYSCCWQPTCQKSTIESTIFSASTKLFVDDIRFSPVVKADKGKKLADRKVCEKKCKNYLVRAVDDSQLENIKDCGTPKEIWSTLKTVFESRGVAGQLYLRKQLLTLRYVEGACRMSDHLLRFDKLIRELKGSGATVEESDAVCHLLLTLPPSFDSVVTAIETLPNGVTMDFVKKRLLDVDLKRRNVDVSEEASGHGVAMWSRQKKKLKCYHCGKMGHKKADCRELDRDRDSVCEKVNNQNKPPKPKSDCTKQKAHVGSEEERPEITFVAAEEEELMRVG